MEPLFEIAEENLDKMLTFVNGSIAKTIELQEVVTDVRVKHPLSYYLTKLRVLREKLHQCSLLKLVNIKIQKGR